MATLDLSELETRFGAFQFEQLLELIAERSGGAVFVVDAASSVVHWSRSAERAFGRTAQEMVGRHCLMGVPCPGCLQSCDLAANRPPRDVSLRLSGRELGFRRLVFPMLASDGSYVGGVELLIPLPENREVRVDGVARLGAVSSSDPQGVAALEALAALALLDLPIGLVSEDPGARVALGLAIHERSPARGLLRLHPWSRPEDVAAASEVTLFVDDVASCSPDLQSAVLLAIAERPRRIRVVAGTARPLHQEVRAGRVRADLGAVLAGCEIEWPALASRPDDVRRLAGELVGEWARRANEALTIDAAALERLASWSWPGGETELRTVVTASCARAGGGRLRLEHLPPALTALRPAAPESALTAAEARRIRKALVAADGNLTRAARILGISRATLYRRRRLLGL